MTNHELETTYVTPRMMGNVKVAEEIGFSHSLTPQEPVALGVADDVVAARGSTNLLGIAIFIMGSMIPMSASGAAAR